MPTPGDFVDVQIQDATAYDLLGTVIPKDVVNLTDGSLQLR